jgi:hypothetical protein
MMIVKAMADYPYKADFIGSYPAWPVKYACSQLKNNSFEGIDPLSALKNVAAVAYKTKGDKDLDGVLTSNNSNNDCYDIYSDFIEVDI